MRLRNLIAACSVGVAMLAASMVPAAALPTFSKGSMALTFSTSTTTPLASTSVFQMVGTDDLACITLNASNPCFVTGSRGDSLSLVANPFFLKPNALVVANGYKLDATNFAHFSWDASTSMSDIGSFTALSITPIDTSVPNVISWQVLGTFTVGSDFANAGSLFSGKETWSLTQTGGGGKVISASGTFFAPVPEPASIALLGSALLASGAFARRRKTKKA